MSLHTDVTLQNIEKSIAYLKSDEASRSLEADNYWPKWHSPWWHMLLLHEMGETALIPEAIVEKYLASLNRFPLKHFPFTANELPPGVEPYRASPCHCQVGNVYQVLAARGVNVDLEAPWLRPWFYKYQMPDGGLNCDESAYLVKDEVPSSMVGTISAFEAVLLHSPRGWSSEDKAFLAKGARFLMDRQLVLGSATRHNADERESAKTWTKLCFPRFYLYDILRGLNALTLWAEKTGGTLPRTVIQTAFADLEETFPDGKVRLGRYSYEGAGTVLQSADGTWIRKQPATFFPLLQQVSEVGQVSPYLSRQWREVKVRVQLKL